jgi:hypothetical protein
MSKNNPGMTRCQVRELVLATWNPPATDRAERFDALLDRVLPEYAAVLAMTEAEVWEAIESRRDYCPANYYQEANFPKLADVTVYQTESEMLQDVRPSQGFRCPACSGVSRDERACDVGTVEDGKVCGWKSYGLLGTMGKGLRVVCAEKFLANPRVHEIFMPVALEASNA